MKKLMGSQASLALRKRNKPITDAHDCDILCICAESANDCYNIIAVTLLFLREPFSNMTVTSEHIECYSEK